MKLSLQHLTQKQEILQTYDIYKACMFLPSREKFARKVERFLADDTVKFFACFDGKTLQGVAALAFSAPHKAEVLGIAVAESARRQGIGSYMLRCVSEAFGLCSVYAETDDDAVGFYRRFGFAITPTTEIYDGKSVTRYCCEWKKA